MLLDEVILLFNGLEEREACRGWPALLAAGDAQLLDNELSRLMLIC